MKKRLEVLATSILLSFGGCFEIANDRCEIVIDDTGSIIFDCDINLDD